MTFIRGRRVFSTDRGWIASDSHSIDGETITDSSLSDSSHNNVVGFVEHAGDSHAAPANVLPTNGYGRKLAALLGAQRYRSIAVSGAMASRQTLNAGGDGGHNFIFQNVTRPSSSAAKPLEPRSQLVLLDIGYNDKAILGPNEIPPRESIAAIISRYRTTCTWEANDAIMALGGGATFTALAFSSGTGYVALDGSGKQVTISIPSWYDGRPLALGFFQLANTDGVAGVTIDGVAQPNLTFNGTTTLEQGGSAKLTAYVRRYLTLAPGAHTIVVSRVSGTTYFNYAQIESPTTEGAVVQIPIPGRLNDYSTYSGYTYPLNDTRIGELKTMLQEIAATFGTPRVRTVDLDPILNASADSFVSDKVHYSTDRHTSIAKALAADLLGSGLLTNIAAGTVDQSAFFNPVWPQAATSKDCQFKNSWVNLGSGFEDAGYRLREDGMVELKGVVTAGSTASAVMFTLPAGYRPKLAKAFPQVANNAFCRVDVLANGDVKSTSGGSTAFTVLDGISFPAALNV